MRLTALISGMTSLSIAFFCVFASAADVDCVPTEVLYGGDWGGQIMIGCEGMPNAYWSFVNRSGCASNDKESIRIWVSLTEAAILAGKTLGINYEFNTTCNNNIIKHISLHK